MSNRKPYRSKPFLAWAKTQTSKCCICGDNYGYELHHFDKKGMGQKATDLLICRVCKTCHGGIQGKHQIAFSRTGDQDIYIKILKDGLTLLQGYVQYMEDKCPPVQTPKNEPF